MQTSEISRNPISIDTNALIEDEQTSLRDTSMNSSLIALQNAEHPQQENCFTATISLLCQDFFSWLADFISTLFCCSSSETQETEEERLLQLQVTQIKAQLQRANGGDARSIFQNLPDAAKNYILDSVWIANIKHFKEELRDVYSYQPENRRQESYNFLLISNQNTLGLNEAFDALINTSEQAAHLSEQVKATIEHRETEERQAVQNLKDHFEGSNVISEEQFAGIFKTASFEVQYELLFTTSAKCQAEVAGILHSGRSDDITSEEAKNDAAVAYMKSDAGQRNVELKQALLKKIIVI
jgi:hypothetical protein